MFHQQKKKYFFKKDMKYLHVFLRKYEIKILNGIKRFTCLENVVVPTVFIDIKRNILSIVVRTNNSRN